MSWKPQWCYHTDEPGCFKPRPYWRTHMTMHGVWPDYGDGTYPTKCSRERFDEDKLVAVIGLDTLEEFWPNVQKAEGATDYDTFWEHEWVKHGTCTGLSQIDYFSTGLKLLEVVGTPDAISANIGGTAHRKDIEDFYGGDGMAVLDCNGQYLSQIYLCFNKEDKTGRVMDQLPCTDAIIRHDDNCPKDIIHISAFNP
ncbi:ribonuclease T2-like protein [Tribonema minus]|uniref:Ribonuclease T2-like protein n=1 Tax=Tribonema minus TaxID=303371 RepID=A0A835YUF6_9STRA|nr:ribonuclease T2-like protein [Tribonema minus]